MTATSVITLIMKIQMAMIINEMIMVMRALVRTTMTIIAIIKMELTGVHSDNDGESDSGSVNDNDKA